MYLTNPESFTEIGSAILEIIDDKQLDSHSPDPNTGAFGPG